MSSITTPTKSDSPAQRAAGQAANELDLRFPLASGLRRQINKIFPTHWSFLLGEIALYSFILLLLTGTYIALFFDPSMQEVQYQGAFTNLQGVEMSRAFQSTLNISFEVRGGLFARQLHHWAALLFMSAIVAHMLRVFFTGAFRRPRETNWAIGVMIFILGMFEGFTGYSLPDDLLSGTGVRITSGITMSVPVIGTWIAWALFGGEFPGNELIPRFYVVHIFLLPGLILGLISVHLALVWFQKHTQFPGVRRTESNVVGVRIMPIFAAKAGAFFAVVVGITAIIGGVFQINPIWNIGPYVPSQISAASQPDWYMIWTDGSSRLFPPWEIYLGPYLVPAVFWPTAFFMGVVFGVLLAWPAIERRLSKDSAHHNLLQRPRDVPVRTSFGVMALTFFGVLMIGGVNDIVAYELNISLNAMTWICRIGLLLAPPVAYYIAYRLCIGLQRADREVLEHGVETGIIRRLPHGEFIEIHQPLGPVDPHGHPEPLPYQGTSLPKKMNKLGAAGHPVAGSFLRPDPTNETAALERAWADDAEREIATENGNGHRALDAGAIEEPLVD